MRPENIQAWASNVEFGHPPPQQPPFDEFGNPVVNVAANIKEWKRACQKQQAERKMQERVFRHQNSNALRIGSSKSDIEAYIKDWKHESTRQDAQREASERIPRPQNMNTPKTGPPNPDVEVHRHNMRKQAFESAERDRIARQRKILSPNSVPTEEVKPDPKLYKIPQRKPVPKSNPNDTTPSPRSLLPPQVILLRNGETKKIENRATYAERVRELGYPELLCPLPMKEIDCMGAKVVKQKDVCHDCETGRLGDRDGS